MYGYNVREIKLDREKEIKRDEVKLQHKIERSWRDEDRGEKKDMN